MKLTRELITKISGAFNKLDPDNEFEIQTQELAVGDEEVIIYFPRDDIKISVDELLKYIPEFQEIKFDIERVASERFTQMPVYCFDKPVEYIINEINFTIAVPTKFKVRLVENPILIGIAATKLGIYDKYAPPCSSYIGVEIEYETPETRLSPSEELKVLKTFLFELSYMADASIDFNIIHESGAFEDYEESEKQNIVLENLITFSEGMDLYRKALSSTDQEIRFLYFYKIIEYYSPIAAKTAAYESLSRKIETLRYKNYSNKDLSAIFSIADKFRVSLSDKELAQVLLSNSIDIVDLFPKLPDEIRKRITKTVHFNQNELSYSTKNETLQGIITRIGSILYSTRNSIVHAKSNFQSDMNECEPQDLPDLNEFLKETCYSIIKWNSRLPDHLKYEE